MTPTLRLLGAWLFLAILAAQARAEDPKPAIDRYLRSEMQRQRIPGLSLAIVKDGRPVYVKSYGVATLEHSILVSPQTVFQLGSIGKQFTAVALLLLAGERRLDLDDSVLKYLPELPPSWNRVTLRLILNHQSGIAQFTTPQRQLLDLRHDYSDSELIRLAASQPLDFEPGTDVSYSDTGYVLLGFVINRVAGMFYGDFLRQRVFVPLGMARTRVISDTDIVIDRASGYEKDDKGTLKNQAAVSAALNRTADGSLYSTVIDLIKWDHALDGDGILPHAELERMWEIDPHRNGQRPLYHYGYGWENNRLRGRRVVEYDGNWQGFQAAMARYPDARVTVVILTNLALCRTQRLAHTVAGLIDARLKPYSEGEEFDSAPMLTADFKSFLTRIAQGSEEFSLLSERARASLVPGPIGTLKRDLRELGPITRFSMALDGGDHPPGGRPLQRVYRVAGTDMVEFYAVRYTTDSRIDDLELLREY